MFLLADAGELVFCVLKTGDKSPDKHANGCVVSVDRQQSPLKAALPSFGECRALHVAVCANMCMYMF